MPTRASAVRKVTRITGKSLALWCAVNTAGCDSSEPHGGGDGGIDAGGGGTGGSSAYESTSPGLPYASNGEAGSSSPGPVQPSSALIEGSRLVAVARHGGVSIIAAPEGRAMRLLHHDQPFGKVPFAVHVREGIVYAVYNQEERQVGDVSELPEGSTLIRVIDARGEPPSPIHELTLQGWALRSQMIGDRLYLFTRDRSGFGQSHVWSFDVSAPDHLAELGRLSVDAWAHAVLVSEERAYLAIPESGRYASVITAIDLSGAAGAMAIAGTVEVPGDVTRAEQLDEYAGVLRVVTHPRSLESGQGVPSVHTFTIEPSGALSPLASLELERRERFKRVRFDRDRAYLMSEPNASVRASLTVIDLGDPLRPSVAMSGQLSPPLVDLEARENRLFLLGFDSRDARDSLMLTSVDTTDLFAPSSSSTVRFGGPLSALDAQDPGVASIQLRDADQLALVPFAGTRPAGAGGACAERVSGVQLIDWRDGSLSARGFARTDAPPTQGVLRGEQLFAVSADRIAAFDVSDRDRPEPAAAVALAQRVDKTASADSNRIVRVGRDPSTSLTELDVVSGAEVELPGAVRLAIPQPAGPCPVRTQLLAVLEGAAGVYVLFENAREEGGELHWSYRVVTVDVSTAASPLIAGDATLDFGPPKAYRKPLALADSGSAIAAIGSTLLFAERELQDADDDVAITTRHVLRVVDMTRPEAPVSSMVELPSGVAATGLLVDEHIVATSHYERSPSDAARVRFFLDRVDLSNPARPEVMPSIRIPGSLLSYDASSGRAITVGYRAAEGEGFSTQMSCYEAYVFPHFDAETTTCSGVAQSLQLVGLDDERATLIDDLLLDRREGVAAISPGTDRVFVRLTTGGSYPGTELCRECGYVWTGEPYPTLLVVAGLSEGALEVGRQALSAGDRMGVGPMAARGSRAVVWSGYSGALDVIDGARAAQPVRLRSIETGFGVVRELRVADGLALGALGADGVHAVQLDD